MTTTQAAVKNQSVERFRSSANTIAPACDILEGADETRVIADVPGVSREALHIEVDNDELRFHATAPAFLGQGTVEYARAFRLPPGLDSGKVSAELKDGVLVLHLPKPAEQKPRKITVN
ncbi:MAG TPA: Hsp20/alpha crystallin family protein [Myxococcota bacterium]|jgi:HSP20 family molecular chaperone IbpA